MSTPGRSGSGTQNYQGQYEQYGQGAPTMAPRDEETSTGAVVGTVLAGVLMILSGVYGFLAGLAMVIKGGFFVSPSGYAYFWTTRGWGWAELILGAVVFLGGVCVMLGMTWARVLGVFLATLSAIGSFMVLPWYPIWSIILIAVDVFIIWALLAYRRRTPA
jgi:hypothetical protein